MPETLEALGVFLLAVLPGALYAGRSSGSLDGGGSAYRIAYSALPPPRPSFWPSSRGPSTTCGPNTCITASSEVTAKLDSSIGLLTATIFPGGSSRSRCSMWFCRSSRVHAMNQEDGSFVTDDAGHPVELGSGLLVRWDEVRFMEVLSNERRGDE